MSTEILGVNLGSPYTEIAAPIQLGLLKIYINLYQFLLAYNYLKETSN